MNFVPYIGAFIAVIPPIVVALIQHNSYWTAAFVLLSIVAIQNIEANFITPYYIGRRVNLNPLAVLMGLILWGFIWGPVGMILATPLTTCIKIFCDNVEPLKPIGVILGSTGERKGGKKSEIRMTKPDKKSEIRMTPIRNRNPRLRQNSGGQANDPD